MGDQLINLKLDLQVHNFPVIYTIWLGGLRAAEIKSR